MCAPLACGLRYVLDGVQSTMDYEYRVPWTMSIDSVCMVLDWYALLDLRNLLEMLHAGATGLRTALLHRPPVSLHIFTLALDRPELDCYSVSVSVLQNTPEYHGFRIVTGSQFTRLWSLYGILCSRVTTPYRG